MEAHNEAAVPVWMHEGAWKAQKLISSELFRQREAAGLTREQLAERMGNLYSADLIRQYEEGVDVPMDTWTVLAMVDALGIDLVDISPRSVLARQCVENGYAELNRESRQLVDTVIGAVLKGQR